MSAAGAERLVIGVALDVKPVRAVVDGLVRGSPTGTT